MEALNDQMLAAKVRKRIPNREKAEDLRRMAIILKAHGCPEDAVTLNDLADLLLDLRQAARGGRRNVYGSRHWNDYNNPHGED